MKNRKEIIPPRWAEKFLEWYCRPELLEDLQGDLYEYLQRHAKEKGPTRARLIYVVDVFKFFRSYTIRKPEFINLLIHWLMLNSYLKTSGRTIVRNKLFSTINIVGLAISMSVGLLMIAFLTDLVSYDKFHSKGDRIYRVNAFYRGVHPEPIELASNSVKTGKRIQESMTGIEDVVILRRGFGGDARNGETVVPVSGLLATESFFNIFDFQMLQGNKKTALKEPYSIVLTQQTARKIFGSEDVLNKTIRFDTIDYVVTGLVKDVPKFSHIQFEALVSFSTRELQEAGDEYFLKWGSVWMNYVYILLPEGGNPNEIQATLDKISAEENKSEERISVTLWLQPMFDIALGPDLSNPIGPTMMIAVVWIVGGLAFIVILSACFNYTNLSIARSLRRSKEVGIRKVIGAQKSHVLAQFIAESVLISMLALALAFGIFVLLRPHFLGIAPELAQIVSLDLTPLVIVYFVALAVVVGIVAGFLPALYFSRINAVKVLKDVTGISVFRNLTMRKALIVIQYTFSLAFIAATMIGYKQYKHALTFDLGFNTANVLNIQLQGNKGKVLIKEFSEIPEMGMMSISQMVTSVGNTWGTHIKYQDPKDSASVWYNTVNENYLPLHQHKLLAGRNFTPKETDEDTEVIVNEQVIKRFNIANGNIANAVGEEVIVEGNKLQIVGVLRDFHYGKIDADIQPVMFRYAKEPTGFVNALVTTSDWPTTRAKLEEAWKKIDPIHPLNATFYEDQIEQAYSQFSAMIKIIGFLAFLAISISSMGLLGMVVFTTETRLKEISIRKVLGATEGALILLLSRGFLILLTFAALVALPLTYLFFEKVVLADITYHAPIGLVELILGVVIVMGIAFIMIGSQTIRVARTNPAEVLKNE